MKIKLNVRLFQDADAEEQWPSKIIRLEFTRSGIIFWRDFAIFSHFFL